MSATSDYEPVARQNYGPTTSSESIFEHILETKVVNNMDVPSIRTPVLRAVPLSSNDGDPEPDSTNHESIIKSAHKIENKNVNYDTTESRCDEEMAVDSLPRIMKIEETNLKSVGHIAYPILQDDDTTNVNYVENTATIIQAPLSSAIVQNVTKMPQNFTINMDGAVGNIAAIQNVSQDVTGSQTLWLPTILAASASTDIKNDDDRPANVSQIIITSESYMTDPNPRRANIIEANYPNRPKNSKVQILSNISLPKNSNFTQQYIAQTKDITTQVYGTQNHVYKLSANVVSQKQINNSVLCTKPQKNQSLIGGATLSSTIINNSPVKNVTYGHTFTKSTNIGKVNNGANLNAMVAASSNSMQCHILSRVVSGPNKVPVHSGKKSVNTVKGKNSQMQKNQSRPIKIIQQSGTAQKSENKTWPVASVTYKAAPTLVETNTSKVIQKVGSPNKNQQPLKVQKTERLVLQSPCGPVLLTTAPLATSLPKTPQYVQSGTTPNLRYVQTYGSDNQVSTISQVSANQQLTAQILQSLSQPKLMLSQNLSPMSVKRNNILVSPQVIEEPVEIKPAKQKRIMYGDKSTLLTADDIIGIEERPNLSEEIRRYSNQGLVFVMLDHTYALPVQKEPAVSSPTSLVISSITTTSAATLTTPAPIVSPMILTSPAPISPMKTSPALTASSLDLALTPVFQTPPISVPLPITSMPLSSISYKPKPPQDDDAASVISSIEGERRPPEQGGSDTETAPEGEEEGKTRCICDFTHDDGYMICCDRCGEWQHVDCMGIDRNNIPDSYMCELCQPRSIDRRHARAIQLRKREELSALGASDSDSSECNKLPGQRRKRLLTVTTYTNTSGSCVTTYNSNIPVLPPLPQPSLPTLPSKRGPKRPKKSDLVKKVTKRKLTEKRVKRKKEMMLNRNKYNSNISNNQMHWRDLYEIAVTNHYSPELRAKIMKYSSKLGNTSNMASAITAHLCTTVPHAGGKILIATKDLKENTPIIELRGKYMLSVQHRPQLQNSARAGGQKPGPFVFFYRLPKDNTQICIDTRTYGNEARFVRRSCKPNAELQHCIVKGALHVYLTTIGVIQSNTEITVGHDSDNSKQPCACGNPKHCKINGMSPTSLPPRKSIDLPLREKRSRNRCYSSSSPLSPPLGSVLTTPTKDIPPPFTCEPPLIKQEKRSPIKHELPPMSPVKEPMLSPEYYESVKCEPPNIKEEFHEEIDLTAREEMKSDLDEPDFGKIEPKVEEKPKEIIKAMFKSDHDEFEDIKPKLEIFETTENLVLPTFYAKMEKFNKSLELKSSLVNYKVEEIAKEQPFQIEEPELELKIEEKPPTLEFVTESEKSESKEVSAKSACHDRSARTSRTTCVNQDSLDDKTDDSQDKLPTITSKGKEKRKMTREERKMEAIMKAFERMERAEQRKQEVKERQKRRESDPHPHNFTEKEDEEEVHNSFKKRKRRKGRARTASQSNRRRLNSADSDMVTSGDEAHPFSPPHEHSRNDPMTPVNENKPQESVTDNLGLSSACLLVEAAVGSVESAFKQPKTKKTMATEWIGRSPERTPSPYNSPYRPSLVSTTSLESLVRVASTMIGDLSGGQDYHEVEHHQSPPMTPGKDRNKPPKKAKRVTRSTPAVETAELPQNHSAKKRWLRQAISEESDSPCPDTFVSESPPNEMVTPLKKRRMARESLSCDQNPLDTCNDEVSPVMTSEDSPVKEDSLALARQYKRNLMDMYARDRTRSDSGQGSDDQCNIDHDVLNMNLKGPHNTEHIRRIIGVPDDLPEIPKSEEIAVNNNNNLETEEINNKVVPMEIDTTVITQSKLESNEVHSDIKCIDSPVEKIQSSQSADTSGNSSPQRDEMDDIQKKIHSFHTENIQILKSRNKKPPKEKRKKVNLNFDLNMVDDQISIQLRTDDNSKSEFNGDIHDDTNSHEDMKISPENIPLPPVELIPLPAPETIPLPEETNPMPIVPPPETIPLPEEPMNPLNPVETCPESPKSCLEKDSDDQSSVLDAGVPFSTRFGSTGLFSGIFSNMKYSFNDSPINENIPNMSLIKSAIDRTTSLDASIFDKDSITPVDELKSVEEILTRVNNMDSNNSVLLSGVLKNSNKDSLMSVPASVSPVRPTKLYCPRTNDPRLNPPPADKPKPVRRKLSISEYRKRHKGATTSDDATATEGGELCPGPEWSSGSTNSSGSASLSPQRLEAAAAAAVDELEQRLHKDLGSQMPKGVFDAQPTASERQRENLSSRLRREFGLALPDDEEARPATETTDVVEVSKRCDR